ncbi:MAG: arginyltransferase [Planctomycetota bacterium]
MVIIHQFITEPQVCAYLPNRVAELEYTVAPVMEGIEYEELMNLGCRKFGIAFFRPVCNACTMCRPIRFSLEEFKPDRSQRRALKKNEDLEVRFGVPMCDQQRIDLFRRYHYSQSEIKHWPFHVESVEEYEFSFVRNQISTTEISIWQDGVLRGVLITENTPNVVSAVYHYHDPDLRDRSLGTFLILKCAEYARMKGKRWVYLGYYIQGCSSMEYKTRYKPSEVLSTGGGWQRLD